MHKWWKRRPEALVGMGGWKGSQAEKVLNNFIFTVKANVNAVAEVLKHSGRVPHKVTHCLGLVFSWTWCFLKLVPTMLLWWGCLDAESSAARSLCLLPSVCALVCVGLTAALQLPSRGSSMAFISGSTKVQSDACVCVTKLWMQLMS